MWDAVGPEARQDWAVQEAAGDPKILATIELLVALEIDKATEDLIKDHLEDSIVVGYGIPRDRSEEVFRLAEARIWQGMEASLGLGDTDGEA